MDSDQAVDQGPLKVGDSVWVHYATNSGSLGNRIFELPIGVIHPKGVIEINHGDGRAGTLRFYGPSEYSRTYREAIRAAWSEVSRRIGEIRAEIGRLESLRSEYERIALDLDAKREP